MKGWEQMIEKDVNFEDKLWKAADKLNQIHDFLLPKLMSGKVGVNATKLSKGVA